MSNNNWPMPQAGEVWQEWNTPAHTFTVTACDGHTASGVFEDAATGQRQEVEMFVIQGCFVSMQYAYCRIS